MTPEDITTMAIVFLSSVPPDRVDAAMIRKTVESFVRIAGDDSAANQRVLVDSISRQLEVKFEITMDDAAFVKLRYEPWLETRRASMDPYYWNRYRRFLSNTMPPRVLGTIDKDTDRIVGLLEDPLKANSWKRRGMCVGHVQSGKTANYIGVVAKAADYGYKFVVLLAGLHNSLRHQTQERVEEGFIGIDSDSTAVGRSGNEQVLTGVGRIDSSKRPVSITSKSSDFKTAAANSLNLSFSAVHEPIVLVIKKQRRILENLTEWLRANNHSPGGVIRGVPMLVIDDEADNASVNTAGGGDPTQINRLIRLLLRQFDQNCYLGYTATPFANIFIDPETEDEMLSEDLFPRDFIVSLEPPGNYVGPERVFLEDGDLRSIIREVDDYESSFPLTHKITQRVEELPSTMKEAIRSFILVRGLRLLGGDKNRHNSMLINVSRFNAVQQQVTSLVTDYLTELRNAVQTFGSLPSSEALQDSAMQSLRGTWEKEFAGCGYEWPLVQMVLNEAVSPVTVRTINNRSADSLDYKAHEGGLNVIAVGGLSLSRGLTLEGLTVSYFLRNSIMYDTLLQMGRWFGYRDGYDKLCRLYMTSEAVSWYGHITEAIDELRTEFRQMERENRRPEDFGLKVRAHPDSLIVTARNKMRTGRKVRHSVSLSGRLVETTGVPLANVEHNLSVLESLVRRLDQGSEGTSVAQGVLWGSVSSQLVREFLSGYRNHDEGSLNTQTGPLLRLLDLFAASVLEVWDVCLYGIRAGSGDTVPVGGRQVNAQRRGGKVEGDVFMVGGSARRVASRGAERAGLSDDEIAAAVKSASEVDDGGRGMSDRFYREQRQRPLLMLHLLRMDVEKHASRVLPAWGISFPGELPDTAKVEYIVNTTWYSQHYDADSTDEGDDDAEE